MRGKVKWFSEAKGYGFITRSVDEGFQDYFFHISDVIGPNIPRPGDIVTFSSKNSKRGEAGTEVRIVETAKARAREEQSERRERQSRDDRVECVSCGKRMVPRLQFKDGEPHARICPFCMESQEKESCFIATAVFGGIDHPVVLALRAFRDRSLNQTVFGRLFVRTYYQISPSIAVLIERHAYLKTPLRRVLVHIAKKL